MRVFLAVSHARIQIRIMKELEVPNILFSYAFYKSLHDYHKAFEGWYPNRLLIDSGAFSVWSRGESIDIDKYIAFCKEFKSSVPETTKAHFINLDVLPGKFGQRPTKEEREQSVIDGWKNMEYIENKGVEVIPVFHQHENFEWLKKMAKAKPYIGISPANDVSVSERAVWLRKVFYEIRDKVKTHGFGVTSEALLKEFPFYSADSSSWAAGARYGRINLARGRKTVDYKNKEQFLANWDNLDNKTLDYFEDYRPALYQGIKTFMTMEKFLTELWDKRGIKWND